MYTQSLFTSTRTCIRTHFTSTCIHFPHQHLLYFSHQHVYTHMFTLTFMWLKYCWYDIKHNQSIYHTIHIRMYTLLHHGGVQLHTCMMHSSFPCRHLRMSEKFLSWTKNPKLTNKRTKPITLSSLTFQCFWFHCSVCLTFHCRDWLPVTTAVICTSQLHKHQLMWEWGQSKWNKGLMFSLEWKKYTGITCT